MPMTFQPFLPKAPAADRFLQGQAPSACLVSPGTPCHTVLWCFPPARSGGHPHKLGEWPSLCGPKVHERNKTRHVTAALFLMAEALEPVFGFPHRLPGELW